MNNEQKAKEIQVNDVCCVWNGGCPNVRSGALEAMRWKDEQFESEKQQWIDKACEWLEHNVWESTGWDSYELSEAFKNYMKGDKK